LESIRSWSLKDKTPTPESMFWLELEFIPELEFYKRLELELEFYPEFKKRSGVGVLSGVGVS
jgi:hypothetical protein